MNLLLLHPRDLLAPSRPAAGGTETPPQPERRTGQAEITGDRLRHLRRVLGVGEGDQVRVGLLNGPVGTATIESIDRERAELTFDCAEPPPRGLDVDLLLALPRPKFLGRILQNAASMGVRSIHLFQSARVEKSYWSSRLFEEGAMERHLVLGLEQGRDTRMPTLRQLRRFDDVVTWVQRWAGELGDAGHVWLADESGSAEFPRSAIGETALVIGPEGGLLENEVACLVEAGARSVSLGPRPLRVETAVSVCLGRFLADPG